MVSGQRFIITFQCMAKSFWAPGVSGRVYRLAFRVL